MNLYSTSFCIWYLPAWNCEVSAVLGLEITESAVCKFLHKAGLTHHKLATYALQRDDTIRAQFVADVSLSAWNTSFHWRNWHRQQRHNEEVRYSLRGKPLKAQKLLVRGEHLSCIVAMSIEGIVAIKIARGSVDGDGFYDFVCTLLGKLMPFNGMNPNSVLILGASRRSSSTEWRIFFNRRILPVK